LPPKLRFRPLVCDGLRTGESVRRNFAKTRGRDMVQEKLLFVNYYIDRITIYINIRRLNFFPVTGLVIEFFFPRYTAHVVTQKGLLYTYITRGEDERRKMILKISREHIYIYIYTHVKEGKSIYIYIYIIRFKRIIHYVRAYAATVENNLFCSF